MSLIVQNICVLLSSLAVSITLVYEHQAYGIVKNLAYSGIISLAILADLASVGYKIAIEKDWIVVVSQGNTAKLASKSVHPLHPPPPQACTNIRHFLIC